MIKLRLHGTVDELKKFDRYLCKLETRGEIEVLTNSELYADRGQSKYFRKYLDLSVNEIAKEDINLLQEENKQLKQQLAESEKEIKRAYQEGLLQKQFDKDAEIMQLRQQLAEKETEISLSRHEINTLKNNLNIFQEHDNIMCEQYFNKCKEINQDKIEFAIAELKKVKKWVIEYSDLRGQNWEHTLRFINNQIKQLKEGK